MLIACNVLDSPTEFTQATPVSVASNGMSVIFKSPGESNNCLVMGGITFSAVTPRRNGTVIARLSYQHSNTVPRNDILTLTTEAGTLSINGHKQYSLVPAQARASWRPLPGLGRTRERLRDTAGAEMWIMARRQGSYFVRSRDHRRRDLFSGVVAADSGKVYVWDAVFTPLVQSYSGKSEHDCGNWDTAREAAKALGRVEASIPMRASPK